MRHPIFFLTIALLAACTSEKVLEEEQDISGSTDPMRFTVTKENLTPAQRASNPLTSGFMVSCYKLYNHLNQQTVMPQYEVRYHTTGTAWDGTVRAHWTYDDVDGQYLRYWDYSAFPYRFNAIAPYPANPAGYVLSDASLKVNAPYYAQTCQDGLVAPDDKTAEPHLIAQVERNTDGYDYDLVGSPSEINNGSTTKNRDVWMPFHHVNSKIRFGIYHTTQWLTNNKTYVKDLHISVVSAPFATGAASYEASGTGSWRIPTGYSGFKTLTTVTPTGSAPHEIFTFSGGASVEGNDLTECQSRKTAYFLQCPGGIMQIPQEHVEMTVSFDLCTTDGNVYMSFRDVPVRIEDEDDPGTFQNYFDWTAGVLHTYYLVIGQIEDKLKITFTATLVPWEDVTGSLSTDLEQ